MGHTEEVRGAMDFSKEVLEEKDEIEDTIEDDMLPF
jgi:hypothetical protein